MRFKIFEGFQRNFEEASGDLKGFHGFYGDQEVLSLSYIGSLRPDFRAIIMYPFALTGSADDAS